MKIMELLQGVDSNTRKTDTYVEYESETWKSAFSLEVTRYDNIFVYYFSG